MLRSSELVMKLNGTDTEQAADTDGAYELVFGRSMGKALSRGVALIPVQLLEPICMPASALYLPLLSASSGLNEDVIGSAIAHGGRSAVRAGDSKWRSILATGGTMLAPLLGRSASRQSVRQSSASMLKVCPPSASEALRRQSIDR